MQGFRLGTRAFTSFRVWLTILLWVLFYSDGAGFGVLAYIKSCLNGLLLTYQPVLPPDVSVTAFLANAAVIWTVGFYHSGMVVAFFAVLLLVGVAARLDRYGVERCYSLPYILAGCLVLWPLGLYYEIHQIVATGKPECGPI